MAELDYQMALLLQHKFDQEKKSLADAQLAKSLQEQYEKEYLTAKPAQNLSDSHLARTLQEQFEKEYAVEKPGQNLVYDQNGKKIIKDPTKCLIDPSWEVIDPTPDIHTLFIAFNQRFFWNKLLAVCVSWSKRMTTCAGICSYQGRGGMCSITLSEPLLKLRPRKDLVETLLHEMIHAFLFVTNNNRDRDGHGPEFHKHMYRINGEAGTNITVYHDFYDEVRLYQQHWWRCNGPCQKRKPYFGMVRRAMNRAPGPSDRWWGQHSRDCGGTFVKVKEPEKPDKPKKKSQIDDKTKPDIRNYITTGDKKLPAKTTPNQFVSIPPKTPANNVHIISGNSSSSTINNVIPKSSNIFGFTGLNGTKKTNVKGSVRNNSNTIVINKKPSTTTSELETPKRKTVSEASIPVPQSGPSHIDYSIVRNHWANKFPKAGTKRTSTEKPQSSSEKLPKLSHSTVECPICTKNVPEEDLNAHLDVCLRDDNLQMCIICEKEVPVQEYPDHVKKCTEEAFSDDVFEVSDTTCDNNDKKSGCDSNGEEKQCEVCNKKIPVEDYPTHINNCLHEMYNNIEARIGGGGGKEETIDCLACGEKITKSELNCHLEDCLSMSRIFEDDNEPAMPDDEEEKGAKSNCPFCTGLFSLEDMSYHIDVCLGIVDLTKC
ncbi:hypothetical protein JTB14_017505 [Gonioctena quinquepunctata]|nr:hypothetical protein JTB14_017505 [Gonioctena quinquepunctata]